MKININFKDFSKKIFNIVLFITILFFYLFYSAFVVIILDKFHIDVKSMGITSKTIVLTLLEAVPVIVLGLIYRKDLVREFGLYKKNFKSYFKFSIKWWGLGLIIMAISNILIHVIFSITASNENTVQKLLKELPVYIAISSCLFAPIIEELIFRKSLKNCFKKNYLFIITSGLIFGGLHVLSSKEILGLLYIIPYGAFGSIFAYIYCKTRNIYSTIIIHMIHNTILIVLSILSSGVL